MGFIQAENTESVTWMIEEFQKCITKAHGVAMMLKMVAFDGNYAIITPVRKFFPIFKLRLDEWICTKIWRGTWFHSLDEGPVITAYYAVTF